MTGRTGRKRIRVDLDALTPDERKIIEKAVRPGEDVVLGTRHPWAYRERWIKAATENGESLRAWVERVLNEAAKRNAGGDYLSREEHNKLAKR